MKGEQNMEKKYEIEIHRSNVTPKQFFEYCKEQMEKRTGETLDNWIESYEEWETPTMPCNSTCKHEDWDKPTSEVCKLMSFDWHLFLQKTYNFIMEFEFDTERKGHGYMYAVEFES